MTPAALIAALPPAARPYIAAGLDPAAAYIALHDGLTVRQARSRARNDARSLGASWPDRLPAAALADAPDLENLPAADPLEMQQAVDAALAALAAPGAAAALHRADLAECDTAAHAAACGITQRRAQQIRREHLDLAERQMPLFDDLSDDEEGAQ
uniref:ATPase central domain-containing protein n=1 Tax=Thiomonas intermedia (strain K12) TaxID=75379 RepID=D5X4Y6_THIK1